MTPLRLYSAEEKRKAILREINYRKFVYPRRVEAGTMTQKKANEELAIFEEIAADYTKLAEKERLL